MPSRLGIPHRSSSPPPGAWHHGDHLQHLNDKRLGPASSAPEASPFVQQGTKEDRW
ncbi:hypothetical protein ACWEO4_36220 [Streptomyces sp. NPDC004393]